MQSILNEPESEAWAQIAPLLDAAMLRLGEKDRNAIVLRYFENKNLREIGAALGASEDSARVRINRALEKLRKFFTKRGVMLSAAVIATAVSANSIQAAPVGLAATISAAAVKSSAVAASTLTLVKGALKLMAWTTAKTVAVTSVAVILAASTTTVAIVRVKNATARTIETYFTKMDSNYLDAAPPLVILRPSKYANKGDYVIAGIRNFGPNGTIMRRGCAFTEVLTAAYGVGPEQMVLPANLPRGRFDLLLTLPNNSREALRAEIKNQFGLVAHTETRDTDVLVLKVANTNAPGLKISNGRGPNIWTQQGDIKLQGYKMSDPSSYDVVHTMGAYFNVPVIDETGLTDAYDVDFKWNANLSGDAEKKDIMRVLREQFGLELVPDRRPMEMLVVEKAN